MAYKLLKNPAVIAHIDGLKIRSSLQTGLTIADWLNDLRETTEEARKASAWSAAMKGYELQGRHIGALKNDRSISDDERKFASYLGAAMQREFDRAERANSSEVSDEDTVPENPPRTVEVSARIIE